MLHASRACGCAHSSIGRCNPRTGCAGRTPLFFSCFMQPNQIMKIQIDIKSAIIGLALGISAIFCLGSETSSNPVGKYQVQTGVSNGMGFGIIIDTQTGEAWGMLLGKDWSSNKSGQFWDAK